MFRGSFQTTLLVVFFLIAPASAMAQKAGILWVENKTGTTIRIGCDHYIDARGKEVKLYSYWDFSPGFNGKLTGPDGKDIVAHKFVFFAITPEGESGGWVFDKANQQGYLYGILTPDGLATHKKQAAKATSGYPPLTIRGLDIAKVTAAITQGEQRLKQLDQEIKTAQGLKTAAELTHALIKNDPNATNAEKLGAAAAVDLAIANVNRLTAERKTVQFNLETNRTRLRELQARPD